MINNFDNEKENQYDYEPLTEADLPDGPFDELKYDEQKISEYYTKRRLEKNRMERQVRKTQMTLSRVRVLLRLFVIAVMMFVGYKLLRLNYWYLPENIFSTAQNQSLEIMNNRIVPSSKILSVLRRTSIPHTPIYRFETDEIKNNILNLDPINDVFVRRFWFPARLQIIVEEKVPVLTISPSEAVPPIAFFAKDGTLIGREYMPLNPKFHTTSVISYGTRGDDYRNWTMDKITLIDNVAKAVKVNSGEDVMFVDLRNPKDVYVKIKTANIRLGELDDTVFDRIKRIPSILPQVKMLDKPIKYIDLRWKNTNYIKLG